MIKVRGRIFFYPYYLLVILSFFLIIIASGLIFFANNKWAIPNNFLEQKSRANIYTQENILKIDFKISQKDMAKAVYFSDKLNMGTSWIEGVEIELDEGSIQKLNQRLPLKVALDFLDQDITFKSNSVSLLSSGLPGNSFELASNSGKLSFKSKDSRDFAINIENPSSILEHATSSGKLFISNKLDGLFPILNKVDTISIDVRGKNLSGQVVLK